MIIFMTDYCVMMCFQFTCLEDIIKLLKHLSKLRETFSNVLLCLIKTHRTAKIFSSQCNMKTKTRTVPSELLKSANTLLFKIYARKMTDTNKCQINNR